MNTIKLFLTVVVLITADVNSLKFESTAADESDHELYPSVEEVIDEIIEDELDPSYYVDEFNDESDAMELDDDDYESDAMELDDDDYELEPEFVTRILLIGGCPNILDQMLICMAVENLLYDVDLSSRYAPSPTDSAERDESEKCELYESGNGEQGVSTRLFCPSTKNSAESVYAASAEGQNSVHSEGFYVQANQTGDGVDVLDKNREPVQTIPGKDLAEAAENLSKEDLVFLP